MTRCNTITLPEGGAVEITPALALILQASLHQGAVPDDWKIAIVTPSFKKDDKGSLANNRPISLTSVYCKVVKHIHSQVMQHYIEDHTIISSQQHGIFADSRRSGLVATRFS